MCLWPYAGQENIADRAADREQPGQKPDEVERRTYEELGKELGLDPAILKKRLPLFAQELKRSPNATTYERANAAFVAKDYNEAERLALTAADEARSANPPKNAEAIKALELALVFQGKYAEAEGEIQQASASFGDCATSVNGIPADTASAINLLFIFMRFVYMMLILRAFAVFLT